MGSLAHWASASRADFHRNKPPAVLVLTPACGTACAPRPTRCRHRMQTARSRPGRRGASAGTRWLLLAWSRRSVSWIGGEGGDGVGGNGNAPGVRCSRQGAGTRAPRHAAVQAASTEQGRLHRAAPGWRQHDSRLLSAAPDTALATPCSMRRACLQQTQLRRCAHSKQQQGRTCPGSSKI